MRLLVFTDLDGTLLDHEDYSVAAAEPALARLRELEVPVVMVTSKTRAEVERLRARLGSDEPFITENGGGVFFPHHCGPLELERVVQIGGYSAVVLGRSYSEVRAFVERHRGEYPVEGFGDMTVEQIAELTGLDLEQAADAARREFTEPFHLEQQSDLESLSKVAAAEGFSITTGGRLYHLIGAGQDKGNAVEIVSGYFRERSKDELVTVGVGDSPNDLPMLEVVDWPVVIPRPTGERLELDSSSATYATQPGSRGWFETMSTLMARVYSGGP